MKQCLDLQGDRDVGAFWERNFCRLAGERGLLLTPHQLQLKKKAASAYRRDPSGKWNPLLLPDITVWTAPGEHHEVKHKDPAKSGPRRNCIGLERYRFRALVEFMDELPMWEGVYYTIHRHDLAPGGKRGTVNDIAHWFTVTFEHLRKLLKDGKAYEEPTNSYVNGEKRVGVDCIYWPVSAWKPLGELWGQRRIV